jgi:hypothetical protein
VEAGAVGQYPPSPIVEQLVLMNEYSREFESWFPVGHPGIDLAGTNPATFDKYAGVEGGPCSLGSMFLSSYTNSDNEEGPP